MLREDWVLSWTVFWGGVPCFFALGCVAPPPQSGAEETCTHVSRGKVWGLPWLVTPTPVGAAPQTEIKWPMAGREDSEALLGW